MIGRIGATALLVVAIGGCSGNNASVVSGSVVGPAGTIEDGSVVLERTDGPPIEASIGRNGIEGVTPLPNPITPIIPVATPQPTATPRP